jgi:hypothetical protein
MWIRKIYPVRPYWRWSSSTRKRRSRRSFPSLSSGERFASNFSRDHSNFLRVALIADNSEEADARRLLRRLMDETIEYSIIKIKTAKITPQVFGLDSDAIMLAIASDIQEMTKPEVPIVFPCVTAMSLSIFSLLFYSTPLTPVRFQNHITNQSAGKHRFGSSNLCGDTPFPYSGDESGISPGRVSPRGKGKKPRRTLRFPGLRGLMERARGFEPPTSTLARLHSTTELRPRRELDSMKIAQALSRNRSGHTAI